jgi:hypothetical protein
MLTGAVLGQPAPVGIITSSAMEVNMSRVRLATLQLLFSGIAVFCVGCPQAAQDSNPKNPPANKAAGPPGTAFLDKKKQIPAGLEWNTNVISKSGGQFSFRVASQGPFAVTIVNEAGYQAMMNNDQKNFKKSDVLFSVDSRENTYEGKVTIPPGTSWFIIENQAKKEVEFHLQCFAQ